MADPAQEARVEPAGPVTPLPRARQAPRRVRRWGRRLARFVLLGLVPIAVAAVGAYVWMIGGRYVETDNAYVRADKVEISPEVSGRVTDVAVTTNQAVAADHVLFRVDDEPYRIALAQAEAQLDMVRTEIAVLRATYGQLYGQLALAKTDAAYYEQEYRRQAELAERNVVSGVKADEARHEMDMAREQVTVRQQELAEVLAQLGGDPAAPDESFARFVNARARRDRAALDLRNTVVRAPTDGLIGRVALRPGSFVEPGRPVITLVETADIWLEANLKEGTLTHVDIGQPVTVRVDAYPDHLWRAKVASFSPATGAEFSVLPPQNATGNWVKVVQRVPVRLRIERLPDDPPLRVGMSATVSIDTGYERPLPALVTSALAWLQRSE